MSGIDAPIVPTDEALRAALVAPDGVQRLIADLYRVASGTAQSLSTRVGNSAATHDDLELQNARLAADLEEVKKTSEAAILTMNKSFSDEVVNIQRVVQAQVGRVDSAIAEQKDKIATELSAIKTVIEVQVKRIDGEEREIKTVIDAQLVRINAELEGIRTSVARELIDMPFRYRSNIEIISTMCR